MSKTNDKIRSHIAMLLRDHPVGTTADLLDYSVAYWDGCRVVGVHLCANRHGQIEEDFDVSDAFLNYIPEAVDEWLNAPHYTLRPALLERLKGIPTR